MPIVSRVCALPNPQIAEKAKKRRCPMCGRLGVHCHGPRARFPSPDAGTSESIEVHRMLCQCCRRTYTLLPRMVLRRVRASLKFLLELQRPGTSWMEHFQCLDIAWNTLHFWKKLGRGLLEKLPVLLETVSTWAELSTHLSRWQYPNFSRRWNPTIP